MIVGLYSFELRAERSGTDVGCPHAVSYRVTDACSNSSQASATVTEYQEPGQEA